MGAVVVVGTHWGDEAKGKFVDLIGQDAEMVIRYGGGPNAGHTVIVGEHTYKFHLIPSGILNPKTVCVMADGMVIDPAHLLSEIESLTARGIAPGNLRISQNAHVILPYHADLDRLEEAHKGAKRITKGDDADRCLISWLAGNVAVDACDRSGCVVNRGEIEGGQISGCVMGCASEGCAPGQHLLVVRAGAAGCAVVRR